MPAQPAAGSLQAPVIVGLRNGLKMHRDHMRCGSQAVRVLRVDGAQRVQDFLVGLRGSDPLAGERYRQLEPFLP